jgi:hypothetical protein
LRQNTTLTVLSQGSHILSILLSLPSISSVHAFARREPSSKDAKLQSIVSKDSSEWPSKFSSITPPPSIFFSGLGTTRAAAGGVANQRKIDYDLNFALAKAAKDCGVKVYVLISSASANASSSMAYPKMKGELEESVKALGFEHTVILRPGLIVGSREESRPAEFVVRKIAGFVGILGSGFKDGWAQDTEVIARAAVASGLQALQGKAPEQVWVIGQSDIVRLGRTEWKV